MVSSPSATTVSSNSRIAENTALVVVLGIAGALTGIWLLLFVWNMVSMHHHVVGDIEAHPLPPPLPPPVYQVQWDMGDKMIAFPLKALILGGEVTRHIRAPIPIVQLPDGILSVEKKL